MSIDEGIVQERIAEVRRVAGLKQEKFAKELGLSKQTISNYETGSRQPGLDIILNISEKFNVSTDYLLGKSDYRNIEDEAIASIIPFSGEAINRMLVIDKALDGYLQEIIIDNNFFQLLTALKGYEDACKYDIGDNKAFKEALELAKLPQLNVAKMFYRSSIDNAISSILEEIDNRDEDTANILGKIVTKAKSISDTLENIDGKKED